MNSRAVRFNQYLNFNLTCQRIFLASSSHLLSNELRHIKRPMPHRQSSEEVSLLIPQHVVLKLKSQIRKNFFIMFNEFIVWCALTLFGTDFSHNHQAN